MTLPSRIDIAIEKAQMTGELAKKSGMPFEVYAAEELGLTVEEYNSLYKTLELYMLFILAMPDPLALFTLVLAGIYIEREKE